jgi:capsular exopolysaccharide synthesis family protein
MSNVLTIVSLGGRAGPANGHHDESAVQSALAGTEDSRVVRAKPGTVSPLLAAQPDAAAEEQYRIIRTKLLQRHSNGGMLVISSPSPGDGKTITALHLAATLATSAEHGVLLLEADLRRPSMHRYLGISQNVGLSNVLTGANRLDEGLFAIEGAPNLSVLLAGTAEGGPADLLSSSQWRDLSATLRTRFPWIIVDSPPIGAVTDFDLIHAVCDSAVLVVRPDHSDRTLALEAIKTLGPKLSGVVLNGLDEWFLWKPYRYGAYCYANGKRSKKRKKR